MDENVVKIKKEKTKLIILVVSLVVLITSATYAYFVSSVSSPAISDVNLGSEVSGGLTFTAGSALNLTASLANFAEGDGSLSGSTESSANLKASSAIGSATENYYIYFNITENNFVYSQDVNTPELLLTITDPNGNELTSLTNHPDLTHKTVIDALTGDEITGFDVTTFKGLITVDDSYEISTTDTTVGVTQNWNAKLTFVNLNVAQTLNEGKDFKSELILQKDMYSFANIITDKNGGVEFIESKSTPDFSSVALTNEGMFAMEDDHGTSYYFRGAVDNNWVEFAGFYWRIIRINGDRSVRLIYSGNSQPTESQSVFIGSNTHIGQEIFHDIRHPYSVNYKYGATSSEVKILLEDWYQNNLLDIYGENIHNGYFCGDTTVLSESGEVSVNPLTNVDKTYGFGVRQSEKQPKLVCSHESDLYFVDNNNANRNLIYPIALITGDELMLGGFAHANEPGTNYLSADFSYWTMSPDSFGYRSSGGIGYLSIHNYNLIWSGNSYNYNYVRPVINLNKNVVVSGSGQWNDPYIVK